jgi:hypothetical protein
MEVSVWRFTWSNSFSGNDGWRSISAAIASAPGRFARIVSIDAPSLDTPTFARILSRSSRNCSRVRFAVPRESIEPASEQAVPRFAFDCSSPQRSPSCATTVPPRVFFGSITSCIPDGSVRRITCASMFSGVGSNISPMATSVPPLRSLSIAATSGGRGTATRSGWVDG